MPKTVVHIHPTCSDSPQMTVPRVSTYPTSIRVFERIPHTGNNKNIYTTAKKAVVPLAPPARLVPLSSNVISEGKFHKSAGLT